LEKNLKIGDNQKRQKKTSEEGEGPEYETKDDVEYQSGKVNTFTPDLQEQM